MANNRLKQWKLIERVIMRGVQARNPLPDAYVDAAIEMYSGEPDVQAGLQAKDKGEAKAKLDQRLKLPKQA